MLQGLSPHPPGTPQREKLRHQQKGILSSSEVLLGKRELLHSGPRQEDEDLTKETKARRSPWDAKRFVLQ